MIVTHFKRCSDVTVIRDLKQARRARAVNKQLNFRVKKKPQTTDYVNTVLSLIFNHKICFKYAVYIVGCVWFVFNGKI